MKNEWIVQKTKENVKKENSTRPVKKTPSMQAIG